MLPLFKFCSHVVEVRALSPPFILLYNDIFTSRNTSITIRQTRNPLVSDVQYITSKRTVLPNDPNAYIDLSALGFGNPSDEFIMCGLFLFYFQPSSSLY